MQTKRNPSRKILHIPLVVWIVMVFIILLEISLLTFFSGKSDDAYVITITEQGPIPKTASIDQNSTVEFVNRSENPIWIASDYHPTHDLYPDFDSRKPIDKNHSWLFTFKKSGYWAYHDHLNPSLTGEIVVEGLEGNSNSSLPKTNIASEIRNMVKKTSATDAWRYFQTKYADKPFYGDHDIAHFLGSELYNEKKIHGLQLCDTSFAFGCYHGHIERLIEIESIVNLKNVVAYCQKFPKQTEITCYHGIGHGILPHFKYDIQKSLHLCDTLLAEENRAYCYQGIFMENSLNGVMLASADSPFWPCTTLADKYKSSCYRYQIIVLNRLFNNDPKEITQACSELEEEQYTDICIESLGRSIAQSQIGDIEKIKQLCSKTGELNRQNCIIAAAEELVFLGKDLDYIHLYLCQILDNKNKEICFQKSSTQLNLRLQDR